MTKKKNALFRELSQCIVIDSPSLPIQIVSEDARLRAACTEANQGAANGAEARLEMELNDLLTQETAIKSEATWAEARVQR